MPEEVKNENKKHEEEVDTDQTDKPKKLLTDYFPRSSPLRRETIEKIIQTDEVVRLLDEIISDAPPDDYWYKQAESKRKELEEALEENERLFKIKDDLIQKNKYYKLMLEEANTFISVIQDVTDESADDTGIELDNENNAGV